MKYVIAASAAVVLVTGTAVANPLDPVDAASIQVTGNVNQSTFPFASSTTSNVVTNFNNNNRHNLAAEYAIADLGGPTIVSASVAFDINFSQSAISASSYRFYLYAGDGVVNFDDFDNGTIGVEIDPGGAPYDQPAGQSVSFNFDVAAELQSVLDANPGLTHFGFFVETQSSSRQRSNVESLVFDVEAIPAPASAGLLGLAGVAAVRRRRL